jgi:hypothetical protein
MANLVVTNNGEYIKIVTNVYETILGAVEIHFHKSNIELVDLLTGSTFVEVDLSTKAHHKWIISYVATDDAFIVDTVDGVAPSSNQDLCDKIMTLLNA